MTDATFDKGATMIALRPISSVGGRSFEPGDLFPWRQLALGERRVRQMVDQRKIGELTAETFAFAMKQRPAGARPKGFTPDGLKALGFDLPAAPAEGVGLKLDAFPDNAEPYLNQFVLVPYKAGVSVRYDVFDPEGGRLNPGGRLHGRKQAEAFCDKLLADRERIAAETRAEEVEEEVDAEEVGETYGESDESCTSGQEEAEEQGDGGDVQSESE